MAKKNRINLFRTKQVEVTEDLVQTENDTNQEEIVQSTPNPSKAKPHLSKKQKEKKPVPQIEAVSEHFFTFALKPDLFTLLYSTLVFKWIQTDRVLILVDSSQLGYHIELFLKYFRMNSVFLDNEMPVNTNKHFSNCFLKGIFNICISSLDFKNNSPQFSTEIVDQSPIPCTIIYFDCNRADILQSHSFNKNTKAIYHFISTEKKSQFSQTYESIDERIGFTEFAYDKDQVSHLKYRSEDTFHSITKNDIKKAKTKKINQELLHSKNMQEYFKSHPEEKLKIVKAIDLNSIKGFKPSATFLPSYLIHQENNYSSNNQIAKAIGKNFKDATKKNTKRRKGRMEEYLEELDKEDGKPEEIGNKF